jgi:hypothetical protein
MFLSTGLGGAKLQYELSTYARLDQRIARPRLESDRDTLKQLHCELQGKPMIGPFTKEVDSNIRSEKRRMAQFIGDRLRVCVVAAQYAPHLHTHERVAAEYFKMFTDRRVCDTWQSNQRAYWTDTCARIGGFDATAWWQLPQLTGIALDRLAYDCMTLILSNVCFRVRNSNGVAQEKKVFRTEFKKIMVTKKISSSLSINVDPQWALRYQQSGRRQNIVFDAEDLPMLAPPVPYHRPTEGGGALYTRPSQLLRPVTEFSEFMTRATVSSRLRTPDQLNPVFDALNQAGALAWRVNESILDAMLHVFRYVSQHPDEPARTENAGYHAHMHLIARQVDIPKVRFGVVLGDTSLTFAFRRRQNISVLKMKWRTRLVSSTL